MIATDASVTSVRRTLRRATAITLVVAVAVLLFGLVLGQFGAGLAVGVGLAIGSVNGLLVRRSVNVGFAFTGLSLARLLALSMVALLLSAILGWRQGWLILLGMAAAQLMLVGVAARDLLVK